jgi:hypothetical protein
MRFHPVGAVSVREHITTVLSGEVLHQSGLSQRGQGLVLLTLMNSEDVSVVYTTLHPRSPFQTQQQKIPGLLARIPWIVDLSLQS